MKRFAFAVLVLASAVAVAIGDNPFPTGGGAAAGAGEATSIVDGLIVDADVNASAAINASKLADGTVTSTEFQYIGGLTSDAQTQISAKVVKAGDTMSGTLIMDTGAGTNMSVTEGGASFNSASTETFACTNAGAGQCDVSVDGTLRSGAGAYVVGTLTVDGGVVSSGPLTCNDGVYVRGTLTVDGGMTLTGPATVTGAVNANGGVVAQAGDLTLASPDGGVVVTGRVDVSGAVTVTGATNANGGVLAQAGDLTLASPDGGVVVGTNRILPAGGIRMDFDTAGAVDTWLFASTPTADDTKHYCRIENMDVTDGELAGQYICYSNITSGTVYANRLIGVLDDGADGAASAGFLIQGFECTDGAGSTCDATDNAPALRVQNYTTTLMTVGPTTTTIDSSAVNTIRKNDAFGSAISTAMHLEHGIDGAFGAAGAGSIQMFRTEDSAGVMDDIAGIGGLWTVATAGSETGKLVFWIKSAGTYAERATMTPTTLTVPGIVDTGAFTQSGGTVNLYNGGAVAVQFVIGSDSTADTTRTNNTNKVARIGMAHYVNAEEPLGVFTSSVQAADSYLWIGGGSAIMNAPMEVAFYTAADTTTVAGTKRLEIQSNGAVWQASATYAATDCDAAAEVGSEVMHAVGNTISKCICEQTGVATYAFGAATAVGVCP